MATSRSTARSIRCRSRCSVSSVRVQMGRASGPRLPPRHARHGARARRRRARLRRAPARPRPRRASRRLSIACSASASASGPVLQQWADAALAARGVRAIRLIQGVLGLTRRHPRERVLRRGDRGARPSALPLPDHSPSSPSARRARPPTRPRDRGSGDSPDNPIHPGGFPAMNPSSRPVSVILRLSGMVEALPARVAQAEAAPLRAPRVSRVARRGRTRPPRRSPLCAAPQTSRHRHHEDARRLRLGLQCEDAEAEARRARDRALRRSARRRPADRAAWRRQIAHGDRHRGRRDPRRPSRARPQHV